VLFLHGAGGVPQWLPFFDALAERYELLVPEHPGFGGSADPPWIRSMADLASSTSTWSKRRGSIGCI
jgi:pimeloyl-ACP methyl ester carboxylesterase